MHIPVLQKEVIKYLDPKPNENFIDCTIGGGGHSFPILKMIEPKGRVLGIDWDEENIQRLKSEKRNKLILVSDSFVNLKEIVRKERFGPVSGILFDLGMSSWHLSESGRGFSFQTPEPLDMRYSLKNPLTAAKILNFWSESEIEKVLREFGEERFAKNIAKGVIKERNLKTISTTSQLVKIIKEAIPEKYQHQHIHFATRTFQALRIAVNDELNNLEKVLPQALEVLKPQGVLVVISFHSLEDRIVKNFLKGKGRETLRENLIEILTKKPITPSPKEIKINPRSRSSKLRAAIKVKV